MDLESVEHRPWSRTASDVDRLLREMETILAEVASQADQAAVRVQSNAPSPRATALLEAKPIDDTPSEKCREYNLRALGAGSLLKEIAMVVTSTEAWRAAERVELAENTLTVELDPYVGEARERLRDVARTYFEALEAGLTMSLPSIAGSVLEAEQQLVTATMTARRNAAMRPQEARHRAVVEARRSRDELERPLRRAALVYYLLQCAVGNHQGSKRVCEIDEAPAGTVFSFRRLRTLQGLPFVEFREHSESGAPARAFVVDELSLTREQTAAMHAGAFLVITRERKLQIVR